MCVFIYMSQCVFVLVGYIHYIENISRQKPE